MLAVAPPRGADRGDYSMENFAPLGSGGDNFSDAFSGGDLLEDIDFDDIFVGFDEGDGLPDLEVDPNELFGDLSGDGNSEEQSLTTSSMEGKSGDGGAQEETTIANGEMENSSAEVAADGDAGRKPANTQVKVSQGKKKAKVDWTPDLHRRFVQAVEQLGVEKAVPSKILEIMGIDGLTRHNIASHLQKYRSHRKHLQAREAEAATWSQRRRPYGGSGVTAGGVVVKRVVTAPWMTPTMGFPPPPMHHYRPLHVWGHPTADHAMMHMWPRPGLVPARAPLPPWGSPPPADPSFWHPHPSYPSGVPQVAPCLPPPLLPHSTVRNSDVLSKSYGLDRQRVTGKPVAGILPQLPMYKQESPVPLPAKQLQMELLPSNECIDAALGDVLSTPSLPLPLGLKPPSTESVMCELQRQGISRIPPSCA